MTIGPWLRRRAITGFFVTVPLVASVVAFVWIFRFVDGLTSGPLERLIGRYVPGLGIVITGLLVLLVGIVATNVLGRRLLQQAEALLLHVPVFRTVYAPLKQLTAAFSPDNEAGFKRVVLVSQPDGTRALGFLTREFVAELDGRPQEMLAVYVPSNHLYLGNLVICPRAHVSFPELTVEQGIGIFLTAGMALPHQVEVMAGPEEPVGLVEAVKDEKVKA
jgi:uncharacterized membrane protein